MYIYIYVYTQNYTDIKQLTTQLQTPPPPDASKGHRVEAREEEVQMSPRPGELQIHVAAVPRVQRFLKKRSQCSQHIIEKT